MFSDYTSAELISIFAMQGFAGLILFSVFVLMALGLAIIFGQMGVINMAHGEFMILGAYVTYLISNLFATYLPSLFGIYFFIAMIVSFIAAGALGALVEWSFIRFLYQRPLDTLLATWGPESDSAANLPQRVWRARSGCNPARLADGFHSSYRHHRIAHQWFVCDGAYPGNCHRGVFTDV